MTGLKKALVVDDSKVGRLTMRKKLETLGIGVDLAESGIEALDYLQRQRPDMIFMDHMMPGLDGLEATRRIKASPATQDIPVIVISGSEESEFVAEAQAAGALAVMVKPPTDAALAAILDRLSAPASQAAEAPLARQARVEAPSESGLQDRIEELRGEWLAQAQQLWREEIAPLGTLQQRIAQVELGLTGFEPLRAEQASLKAAIERLRQEMQPLAERLRRLEEGASSPGELPQPWGEEMLESLRPQLDAMRQDLAQQKTGLEALRRDLWQEMEARQERLQVAVQGISQRIDALAAGLQDRSVAAEVALARLEACEQRLGALEASPGIPPEDSDALQTRLQDMLDGALADLGRRLEVLAAEVVRLEEGQRVLEGVTPAQNQGGVSPAEAAPVEVLPGPAVTTPEAAPWQEEMERLRSRLRSLTLASATGGGLLLVGLLLLAL